MRTSAAFGMRLALLGVFVAACREERQEAPISPANHPSPPASSAPPAKGALGGATLPELRKPEPSLCRVIAVRAGAGSRVDAGVDAGAPAVGTAFEGRDWLELGTKTEVVLRHAATTRELALRGPGRFLPCFLGTETVLVARGAVKTTAGAGSRAGAEVILAAPLGTLHFADAALELRVFDSELEVNVEKGAATLLSTLPRTGDAGAPELSLGPRRKQKLSGKLTTSELVARCRETSSPLGTAPPRPNAAPSARALLGEWSAAQFRARQAARWACAAARAAVGREEDSERERFWAELATVDRVWKLPADDAGK